VEDNRKYKRRVKRTDQTRAIGFRTLDPARLRRGQCERLDLDTLRAQRKALGRSKPVDGCAQRFNPEAEGALLMGFEPNVSFFFRLTQVILNVRNRDAKQARQSLPELGPCPDAPIV